MELPKNLSLEKALQLQEKLKERILELKERRAKIQKRQTEFKPEHLDFLTIGLQQMIKKLKRPYPSEMMCSHHGVSHVIDGLSVSMLEGKNGNLTLCLYDQRGNYADGSPRKYSKEEHEQRKKAIIKALKTSILEAWNDVEGSNGFSVLLALKTPPALSQAINNYRNLESPFKISKQEEKNFELFDRWWNKKEKHEKSK